MTSPLRPTLILTTTLIAAALALSACNRDRADKADAPAADVQTGEAVVTPADAAAPMSFARKTEYASVRLTFPDAIKPQGDLHARQYAREVQQLRQFIEGAQADRTEAGGDEGMPPYEKSVDFVLATETGKLFSLKRTAFDWSGGAHPNTLSSGLLWDKALKREIGPQQLFRAGADLSPLDQALCTAINTAKRARVPDAPSLTLGSEGGCPRALATPFVLAPGSVPGKAAGLIFLIGPYTVGAYAEGAYEIAIPVTVFRSLIAPAYADEFAGDLARAGDVTPTAD